ncbi:hypothetical protein LTR16_010472, partial [Cryomyces antarcticus]
LRAERHHAASSLQRRAANLAPLRPPLPDPARPRPDQPRAHRQPGRRHLRYRLGAAAAQQPAGRGQQRDHGGAGRAARAALRGPLVRRLVPRRGRAHGRGYLFGEEDWRRRRLGRGGRRGRDGEAEL